MNDFILFHDFVFKKKILLSIDSIESIYEDSKISLKIEKETEEQKEFFDSLPEEFVRVEIKEKNTFFPISESLDEVIELLQGKKIGQEE